MKKLFTLSLSLILLLAMLSSCSLVISDGSSTVRVAVMKGPTGMGMLKLMEDSSAGTAKNDYEFSVLTTADEITAQLVQGNIDIAALPANLASILFHNTDGEIQVAAINTLGVLYIVEKNESITSMQSLRGKTIIATGKGTVTEWNLRYLLSAYGIDPDRDVTIEFKSEVTEAVAALKAAESGVAMLPQPYVTIAKTSISELNVALDLTEQWEGLGNESSMVTGVIVVRRSYAKAHPNEVKRFLSEYNTSVDYVNAHNEEAAALTEQYIGIKAPIAKQALPYCNITYIDGTQMQTMLGGYLAVLFSQKPASVGGSLPTDDFYYHAD